MSEGRKKDCTEKDCIEIDGIEAFRKGALPDKCHSERSEESLVSPAAPQHVAESASAASGAKRRNGQSVSISWAMRFAKD
jgi:hypothetical protein